ncbi:hypothetical protein AB4124_04925 [Paenibacillus sp. 2KB_20]|uniref:hypothetical protein n=1 Tax=Paenibacillus sp. 2KB_20 TaxID=3232977 RepID=UPI003F988696
MSSNTPNLGLLKKDPMVDGNETFNIETMLNENWDKVDEAVGRTGGYGVTTQSKANEYEVNLKPAPASLTAGIRVTVKINVASTGAPMLNVNGLGAKPVLKTSGSSASFKQDGVYTLVYDGQAFILQGEGGEVGTAAPGDVLEGKTFPGEDGLMTGTMPKRGNQFKPGLWSNPDGDAYVDTYVDIDSGYYPPGSQVTIQAYDPDLTSGNIRSGVNIFGVAGKSTVVDTADAVLDPNMLVAGYSGYDDGVKKPGQMPNRSAENNHMPGLESTVWAGDRVFIRPPHGFYNGETWVTAPAPTLKPENIPKDTAILGIQGTLERMTTVEKQVIANEITAKGVLATANDSNAVLAQKIWMIKVSKYAGGSLYASEGQVYVSGLAFRPKMVKLYGQYSNDEGRFTACFLFDEPIRRVYGFITPDTTNDGWGMSGFGSALTDNLIRNNGFEVKNYNWRNNQIYWEAWAH